MPPEYHRDLHIFVSCQMTLATMRTHARITHNAKACSWSRAKMQSGPQLSQKADLQILRKVLPHLEVSLTASIMAALLFVGWLCSEESSSDKGGSLWLSSQIISNSFYFLPHPLQFSPSFPSSLGPDSNHQYSWCDSVPPQTVARFTCFLSFLDLLLPPSETAYWVRQTTDLTHCRIPYILWWQLGKAEFLSSWLLSIYGDFCRHSGQNNLLFP